MTRWLLALALAGSPLAAQTTVSSLNPPAAVDQTARDSAAAAQAAIPPACAVAPSGDTLNGTVGTGAPCTPPANNTRPTAVQAGNTTLAANCTFSVTFARAFTSSTPFVYAAVVDSGGSQMPCKAQTRSATGFTGVCSSAQTSLLTLNALTSAALTGITLNPFGSTCTAGTPVMFVGREPTQ